jgi:hypothetical protein
MGCKPDVSRGVGQWCDWTKNLAVSDLGGREIGARVLTGVGDWWLDERHEGLRTESPSQQRSTDHCYR